MTDRHDSGICSSHQRFVRVVSLPQPRMGDNTADAERLKAVLKAELVTEGLFVPLSVVRGLPEKLRSWNYQVKCTLFKEAGQWILLGVDHPMSSDSACGIAMDIGTTRVILRLLDLETGHSFGEIGFDNPQARVAPDVLARIHHADRPGGLSELTDLIIREVDRNIGLLLEQTGIERKSLFLLAGAGNTAMTHLFLGIQPAYIIREPYIPAVNAPDTCLASELGIAMNPEARVFLFPNIGSYFGGDLIAGILYSGIHKKKRPAIMVDVGTNAEVVVGSSEWLIACAGAAGPALEGGMSDMGMTAGPGVIDRVTIDPATREITVHTIDDKPPIGICGSGMIDLASGLFLSGMLDIRGKFSKEVCGQRLFQEKEIDYFRLVDETESGTGEPILLSQIDINSLTSSKAAMHSILEVIVKQNAGLSFDELSCVYVAGTFGSFIDPGAAISIGMLPDISLNKFQVIGNSSLEGAAKILLDPGAYDEIPAIRKSITYLELNVNAEFMNIFSGAKFYPHTDRSRFPSVKLPGEASAP